MKRIEKIQTCQVEFSAETDVHMHTIDPVDKNRTLIDFLTIYYKKSAVIRSHSIQLYSSTQVQVKIPKEDGDGWIFFNVVECKK